MKTIYFIEVRIREITIDEKGIGKVTNRLEFCSHEDNVSDLHNRLIDIADEVNNITLGI